MPSISDLKWDILGIIGKGGSSTVFHAVTSIKKSVTPSSTSNQSEIKSESNDENEILNLAVKQIDISTLTKSHIDAINAEIQLMKSFSHPNIVSFLGIQNQPTKILIAMEYASHGSIRQFYHANGRLTEEETLFCLKEILEGLNYLHTQDLAHRDIKCANCLIFSTPTTKCVKLADFGASKKLESESIVSGLKGTPQWMAPEVIRGEKLDWTRADVWSIGCTIVEMLTGALPFAEYQNPMTAMYNIAMGKVPQIMIYDRPANNNLSQSGDVSNNSTISHPSSLNSTISENVTYPLLTPPSGAVELVNLCCSMPPDKRPCINDIKNHWWIQSYLTKYASPPLRLFQENNYTENSSASEIENQIVTESDQNKLNSNNNQIPQLSEIDDQNGQTFNTSVKVNPELMNIIVNTERELSEAETPNLSVFNTNFSPQNNQKVLNTVSKESNEEENNPFILAALNEDINEMSTDSITLEQEKKKDLSSNINKDDDGKNLSNSPEKLNIKLSPSFDLDQEDFYSDDDWVESSNENNSKHLETTATDNESEKKMILTLSAPSLLLSTPINQILESPSQTPIQSPLKPLEQTLRPDSFNVNNLNIIEKRKVISKSIRSHSAGPFTHNPPTEAHTRITRITNKQPNTKLVKLPPIESTNKDNVIELSSSINLTNNSSTSRSRSIKSAPAISRSVNLPPIVSSPLAKNNSTTKKILYRKNEKKSLANNNHSNKLEVLVDEEK